MNNSTDIIIPYEREYTAFIAVERVITLIKHKQLRCITDFVDETMQVSFISYEDSNGMQSYTGAGKGTYHRIGALAELCEHYWIAQQDEAACTTVTARELSIQEKHDGILRGLQHSDEAIPCVPLYSHDMTRELFVPLVLINPKRKRSTSIRYPNAEQILTRYSTNSGTAFGLTPQEALIHAIHELYERDCLFRLYDALINTYYDESGFTCMGSLYDSCMIAHGFISTEHAHIIADAWVIMTTQKNLYFCAVIEKNTNCMYLSTLGSGASLNADYAILRAVSEYIQCMILRTKDEDAEDDRIVQLLQQSTTLKPLITLNTVSNFAHAPLPVKKEWPTVAALLKQHKKDGLLQDIYWHIEPFCPRLQDGSTRYIAQVYGTLIDRFHLIRLGNLVVPRRILNPSPSNRGEKL